MAEIVAEEIGKKVLEKVAEKAVEKIAEKGLEKVEEKRYVEESFRKIGKVKKLAEFAERAFNPLKRRFFKRKKLFIIGGGEIATEIAIAALNTEKWIVRSILGQDASQRHDRVSVEETKVPISNLLFYIDKPPKSARYSTTLEEADPFVRFQYLPVTNLHDIEYVKKYIVKERPDVVLLEDVFLTYKEWVNLSRLVSKELENQKTVHFVPSPDLMCGSSKLRQSDVFLSKAKMKDFLSEIGESEHLLDALEKGKSVVNSDPLTFGLERKETLGAEDTTKQYLDLKRALEKHGKVIFKPESTSSGHGQFILSRPKDLEPRTLSGLIHQSLEFVSEHRVKNDKFLLEKYLTNKAEVCGIIACVSGKKSATIDHVYYTKYDMERINSGRFAGLTRLEHSKSKRGEHQLWTRLNSIISNIATNLSVSFLYVEFLLDNEHRDKYGKPRIFINEISYRPDDAGFVTLLSHETDQFSLFIESLDSLLKGDYISDCKDNVPIKLIDPYICKTLNPERPIRFQRALFFDYPAREVKRDRIKLRLYEKFLAESDGNVDYGRIIGYLWHHLSESDKTAWEVFGALKKALGEDGLNLLRESVTRKSASTGSTSRSKETIVISDWEGPWVTADHAYEVVKNGIPKGDRLFAAISEYDDYLAYVRKKRGYEPGDTLRLIAPFLIAFDLDEDFLLNIAEKNANFIAGSIDALNALKRHGYPLRIISTSYCAYVSYTTSLAGIPQEDIRCTQFPLDSYRLKIVEEDKKFIKEKVTDIVKLEKLGITASTREEDLPVEVRKVVEKLDDFFWKDLPRTSFGTLFSGVNPLGGHRKLEALSRILEEEGRSFEKALVIGDSITDWVMLRRTKDRGGLAISFNGNSYAIRNANVAVTSDNCFIIPVLADLFENTGIHGIKRITMNWSKKTLKDEVAKGNLDVNLFDVFSEMCSRRMQDACWITKEHIESIIERSAVFRKEVRGSIVGSLG